MAGEAEDFEPPPRGFLQSPARILSDTCALRFNVHGVERLAARHEQAIPARAAEADVGADFGE